MPEDLNEPRMMYALLEEAYMSNPMIDCVFVEDVSTTVIRQYISPQSSQTVHVIPWNDSGYSVITLPIPKIEVPEESMECTERFLDRYNRRLERGSFVITDEGCIIFRTYLPCRRGDILSVKSVLEEVNLGTRMFMNSMGSIVRAMDGERYEDIFGEKEEKGSNTSDSFTSEDVYVPASEKDCVKANGGMYV